MALFSGSLDMKRLLFNNPNPTFASVSVLMHSLSVWSDLLESAPVTGCLLNSWPIAEQDLNTKTPAYACLCAEEYFDKSETLEDT